MMATVMRWERWWERVVDGAKERKPKSATTVVLAGILIEMLEVAEVDGVVEVGSRIATAKMVVMAEACGL
jgi:hypothetical protein